MESVLKTQFGFLEENIAVLTDANATRRAILDTFRERLVARAQSGDFVLIHYSGHGSRIKDRSGDEIDGLDETLVAHDSREPGVFDITDDELNALLRELSQRTSKVLVVLDSCHSGSATRGGATIRRAKDDTREPPAAVGQPAAARGAEAEDATDLRPRDAQYVLITGCKAHQLSNEYDFDGQRQGVLTYYFTRALRSAMAGATYRDVMDHVQSEVSAMFPSQEPELEGATPDALLFGEDQGTVLPYVLVSPVAAAGAEVEAGTLLGLNIGTTLDVFEPGTKAFDSVSPIARIRLNEVGPFRSEGRVFDGKVKPFSRAMIRERDYTDFKLRLHMVRPSESTTLKGIGARLKPYANVVQVASEHDCDLHLIEDKGRIVMNAADLTERSPSVSVNAPNAVQHVVDQVLHWARWYGLLNLMNAASPLAVRLRLAPSAPVIVSGDRVDISVENLSNQHLYPTLLDLSGDGSVAVLYPRPGEGSQALTPHSSAKVTTIEFFVPEGRDSVADTIKLLATTTPLDARIFAQPAVKGDDKTRSPGQDPLTALLENTALGRPRNARPVPLTGWVTAQQGVAVSRKKPSSSPSSSTLTPRTASACLPTSARGEFE